MDSDDIDRRAEEAGMTREAYERRLREHGVDYWSRMDEGISFSSTSSSTSTSSTGSSTRASYPGSAGHIHSYVTGELVESLLDRMEDISHILKIIIELYGLDELKPLWKKLDLDHMALRSIRRVNSGEEKQILEDEIFKLE